jgi:N-acetylneuraminic acid mutarotase
MKLLVLFLTAFALGLGLAFSSPGHITWSKGPDVPLPRGGYYAAWYKGGLLLAGGTYWNNKKKHWTDRVSFYDPSLNAWAEWHPLPRPLAYGSMVEAEGNLYLLGGSDEKDIYRDVYRSNGQRWVRIGELPKPVVYATAVSVGQELYVLGGGSSVDDVTQATNSAWSFNTKSGQWKSLPPVPGPPRVFHTSAVAGNHIYVFGGSTQKPHHDLENLSDVHRFDIKLHTWSSLKPAPVAARAWFATPANGYIYLFGGYTDHFLDEVYQYNPSRDEYWLVSRLPLPLADTQFFYQKGTFYGATGEDKMASRFSGMFIGRFVIN